MTPPKRIRLLSACRDHLYNEVKRTLATDKEIRSIRHLDKKISDWWVRQVGATELCSTCSKSNCICRDNQRNADKIDFYNQRNIERAKEVQIG